MVRIAINEDSRVLAEMAVQMWDSHTVDELEAEFVETLNDKQSAFFIKYINDLPVGFAQCGLRTDYVEGTESSPVGYLEGIFVKEEYRKNGYAKELDLLKEALFIELEKYLKAEVDKTIKSIQHLYDKYFVSANQLLSDRLDAESKLNDFLKRLGYINE